MWVAGFFALTPLFVFASTLQEDDTPSSVVTKAIAALQLTKENNTATGSSGDKGDQGDITISFAAFSDHNSKSHQKFLAGLQAALSKPEEKEMTK